MNRNEAGGTELIPMPRPTEAAQLSLPIISYSALELLAGGAPWCMVHGACMVHHGDSLVMDRWTPSPGVPCLTGRSVEICLLLWWFQGRWESVVTCS